MKKPFWDVDENKGYITLKANDGLDYKVWNGDPDEKHQKKWWYTATNKQETAETLARVRKDLNTLLIYLIKNEYLYANDPIAFGIYHTFDLHLPGWNKNNFNEQPFIYQEMRPNDHGILGLNKPKKIITIKSKIDNKTIDYELGKKRLILLTLRNQNNGNLGIES